MTLVKELEKKTNKVHPVFAAVDHNASENEKINLVFLDILWWILCIVCGTAGFYWVFSIVQIYRSEPTSSIVFLKEVETFDFPTVTFCPPDPCYNQTAVEEIKIEHSVTLQTQQKKSRKGGPFVLNDNVDYTQYSTYLRDSRYRLRENIIPDCGYKGVDDMVEQLLKIVEHILNLK